MLFQSLLNGRYAQHPSGFTKCHPTTKRQNKRLCRDDLVRHRSRDLADVIVFPLLGRSLSPSPVLQSAAPDSLHPLRPGPSHQRSHFCCRDRAHRYCCTAPAGILKHGSGTSPCDGMLIYGQYYLLDTLLRLTANPRSVDPCQITRTVWSISGNLSERPNRYYPPGSPDRLPDLLAAHGRNKALSIRAVEWAEGPNPCVDWRA